MAQRFVFEAEVHGAGAFARVIRGRDTVLERDVAVKVLNQLATDFPTRDQDRFAREARILASLSHPNIPAIYDVDLTEGRFLIVFQFVDGRNLQDMIESDGACQLAVAKAWFHQVASALQHAHDKGVVHRDVKPGNMIVTPDREAAYLVDFGIALSRDDTRKLTHSGFVIGTPGYMSPEQQAGDKVGPPADMYSLGVTLYETLAGKPIDIGRYEDLSVANESIPPEVDALINDCLLPQERRIQTAREFSARLAGALRPTKPLSEVLAHGRLHELQAIVEELSPAEFVALPEGQRSLILAKVSDIVGSGDLRLEIASERFLCLLLTRALLVGTEAYREVVSSAIQWGFGKTFGEYGQHVGKDSIRRELERAAYEARGDAHGVIRDEFANFLRDAELADKEDWYLHAVREVLQTLLANPACVAGSGALVESLKAVNAMQRSRLR